ncbi:MAG: heme-binding domain-containing protein [Flavobacterium sp.]|uniref:heme-binding domain-containing protein n=1 Tax=Flavobacterium sp. TaxID=239 RepID=UPI00326590AB
MKKAIRKIALGGLILFVLIQFYQPARNINGQVSPAHIEKVYSMPLTVSNILHTSCYDCHSNNTNYPWYSYIQPARAFLDSHITEGKKELNFSEFGNYSNRKQESKLRAIAKQVSSGEMPLNSYTAMHKNAMLSELQKKALEDWISECLNSNTE